MEPGIKASLNLRSMTLVINKTTGVVTLTNNIVVNGDLTVTSGTLDI